MGHDSLADSGPPIPDRIPDDLLARYEAGARKRVRRRRSRLFSAGQRAHLATSGLKDGEVLTLTLTVFGCSIIGLALVGALVYAVMLWPWAGTGIVLTTLGLLTVSYLAATRLIRKQQGREVEPLL